MPSNPANQRVASNVRAEMKQQGLSQDSLAAKIGEKQHFISRRLTSKVDFTVSELETIALALGVPLRVLVGDGDESVAS